jgi:hypothetical protein
LYNFREREKQEVKNTVPYDQVGDFFDKKVDVIFETEKMMRI